MKQRNAGFFNAALFGNLGPQIRGFWIEWQKMAHDPRRMGGKAEAYAASADFVGGCDWLS